MNINKIVELILSLLTFHTSASKNNSKSQPSPSVSIDNSPKLKEVDGYYVWNKGEYFKLSDHFTTKEMTCHCKYQTCKEQRISKDLIQRLENIRLQVNQPLIVTSAFRCKEHQDYIRGSGQSTVVAKKQSQHELGNAVDILPKDGKDIRTKFLDICDNQFTAIGLSDKFLHVDMRKDRIRWEY